MPKRFYVSASPGQTVYQIGVYRRSDGPRPTNDEVHVTAFAVLAWRITAREEVKDWEEEAKDELVEPITVEKVDDPWHLMPDGTVCRPQDCIVENLDEAKQFVLEEAQRLWDEKHKEHA